MTRRLLTFWTHVEELRQIIIVSLLCVGVFFLLTFFFHVEIADFIVRPLQSSHSREGVFEKKVLISETKTEITLPAFSRSSEGVLLKNRKITLLPNTPLEIEVPQQNYYLFSPLEGFLISLKITLIGSLVFSSPLWIFFLFRFLAPALLKKHRKFLFSFLIFSFLFLFLGFFFAYRITLPLGGAFLRTFNEKLGENLWSFSETVNFCFALLLGHAFVFELYVVLCCLIYADVFTYQKMKKARKGVIIGALLLGALLTPPDVLSQILLALPIVALYEASLIFAKLRQNKLDKKKQKMTLNSN